MKATERGQELDSIELNLVLGCQVKAYQISLRCILDIEKIKGYIVIDLIDLFSVCLVRTPEFTYRIGSSNTDSLPGTV